MNCPIKSQSKEVAVRHRATPAQTSAGHFSLPSVVLLPTCATSLRIDRGPRNPRRAAGGPPLLSGCLPAPSKDGETGKNTTRFAGVFQ